MDLLSSPYEFTNVINRDGQVDYLSHFYSSSVANTLFRRLLSELELTEGHIYLFGKEILEPRLKGWYGDKEVYYRYSGASHKAKLWTPTLLKIKKDIEEKCELNFNSVLVNLYRSGEDYMGPHQDNEKELGQNPVIASLSLGAERDFIFKHQESKKKVGISLKNGSLLLMHGKLQEHWTHGLPKRLKEKGARLNLTFRLINN